MTFGFVSQPVDRGTLGIVWSCMFTLWACVWTVLHLNVPGQSEPKKRVLLRKAKWMVVTAVVPEYTFWVASGQRMNARRLLYFIRRSTLNRQWTAVHAFFADMGGFMLRSKDGPEDQPDRRIPISSVEIYRLLLARLIDLPNLTEKDIKDRSKADPFAKTIACMQLLWLGIQCIARTSQRLPVTQLEVAVLANAICTILTYLMWWDKPLSPESVVYIDVDTITDEIERICVREKDYNYTAVFPAKETAQRIQNAFEWGEYVIPSKTQQFLSDLGSSIWSESSSSLSSERSSTSTSSSYHSSDDVVVDEPLALSPSQPMVRAVSSQDGIKSEAGYKAEHARSDHGDLIGEKGRNHNFRDGKEDRYQENGQNEENQAGEKGRSKTNDQGEEDDQVVQGEVCRVKEQDGSKTNGQGAEDNRIGKKVRGVGDGQLEVQDHDKGNKQDQGDTGEGSQADKGGNGRGDRGTEGIAGCLEAAQSFWRNLTPTAASPPILDSHERGNGEPDDLTALQAALQTTGNETLGSIYRLVLQMRGGEASYTVKPVFELEHPTTAVLAGCISVGFGAFHSLVWNHPFPTSVEQKFWNCATIVIAAALPSYLVLIGLVGTVLGLTGSEVNFSDTWNRPVIYIFVGFYAAARFFIVVEAFASLRAQPTAVYEDIVWTKFLPHL